jgi:hypothetical protein
MKTQVPIEIYIKNPWRLRRAVRLRAARTGLKDRLDRGRQGFFFSISKKLIHRAILWPRRSVRKAFAERRHISRAMFVDSRTRGGEPVSGALRPANFSKLFVEFTSRKCLFLSSFSKHFFGGFEGFQWVIVRKFAFSEIFVSPKFCSGNPRNSTDKSCSFVARRRRPADANRTNTLAWILISGKPIRYRHPFFGFPRIFGKPAAPGRAAPRRQYR